MDQLHSSATGPATPNAPTLDVEDIIQDYLGEGLSAKENANMGHLSPAGLLLVLGEAGLKRDYLYKLRLAGHTALADWHELGMVHIHDLGLGVKTPYCSGHSLENLLHDGIAAGNIISGPAKRLRSAVNHIINHIGACSNEFAGAQAFNDIDLFLGPYALDFFISRIRTFNMDAEMAMKMTMEEVDQSMQELIFHLNYNTRYGGQAPFSNITLSLTIPDDMRDRRPLVGGQTLEDRWGADTFTASCAGDHVTYGDLAMWQHIVGEAILNNFMRGDSKGTGFTFPVLTISVTEEFFQHPLKKKVFELSAKFGNPYFQNYINGYSGGEKLNPSDVRSMCCRLSISEKEIRRHVGGLFGNADQTGSLQVVTLNLPMLAMTARQISGDDVAARYSNFVDIIDAVMEKVKAEQLWKREIVERSFDEGFFSMAKANFKRGFKTFFTTVGFVGLWEAIEAITGDEDSFLKEENLQMAVDVLNHMRGVTDRWTEETGKLFNLEATPAESAAHKLAIKMLKTFPDAPHRGTAEAPYLTNSCHIPVELQNRVDLLMQTQSRLQPLLSGGTVLHLHVGEELDSDGVEAMVRAMCGSPIPYFSVSPVYTKCDCCGRIIPGTHEYCPHEHTDEQVEALRRRRPDLIEE